MDDKGFIFTADATLALIVVIVITASIAVYAGLPVYQGEDHQHLEALAESAINTMDQDGSINNAVVQASFNNSTSNQTAQGILTSELNTIIPVGTGYKMTIGGEGDNIVTVSNNNGVNPYSVSKDVATSVKVVSGPQAGWIGRAWYKQENVSFIDQPTNVTTTLWNFHNYLTNFYPWSYGYSGGLYNNPYWGTSSSPINFAVPDDNATIINGGTFLVGSVNRYSGPSYNATVTINGNAHTNSAPFTFLTSRSSGGYNTMFYNYQGNVSATELLKGLNSFYVNFLNMNYRYSDRYDMPWFSLIGNYTTTLPVPNGTITTKTYFDNVAGLANPNKDVNNNYGVQYYLSNGTVQPLTAAAGYPRKTLTWNDTTTLNNIMTNHNFNGQDDGRPYDIVGGFPAGSGISHASAITVKKTISIPADASGILDGYVVLNSYGGVDDAIVEVYNGTTWQTAFSSLGITHSTTGGYGNTPGIIYIKPYLAKGQDNIVRVTVFDQVPSSSGVDYDLVGILDSYVQVSYTRLQNKWDTYPEYGFPNYQTNDNQNVYSDHEPFSVRDDAKKVIMFLGVGTNTQNVKVDYYPSGQVLYNGPVQFYLDLAAIDADKGYHVITTATSTKDNYYLKNVTDQNIEVTVTSSPSWQSGDEGSTSSNAEIFSGTRVAVLYPQTLQNIWNVAYANDATTAKNNALNNLIAEIHVPPDDPGLGSEALYTGNMPNSIPVRLELWKQ